MATDRAIAKGTVSRGYKKHRPSWAVLVAGGPVAPLALGYLVGWGCTTNLM